MISASSDGEPVWKSSVVELVMPSSRSSPESVLGASTSCDGVAGRLRYAFTPAAILDLLAIAPILIAFGGIVVIFGNIPP